MGKAPSVQRRLIVVILVKSVLLPRTFRMMRDDFVVVFVVH